MTTPKPNPTFTQLPRELRDHIYDYIFGPTSHYFEYGPHAFVLSPTILPNALQNSTPGLPQWLLTDRTMCAEAISHLLRTRHLILCYPQEDAPEETGSRRYTPPTSRWRQDHPSPPRRWRPVLPHSSATQSATPTPTPSSPLQTPPAHQPRRIPTPSPIPTCTQTHNPLLLSHPLLPLHPITLLLPASVPFSLAHANRTNHLPRRNWTSLLSFIHPFLDPAHIRLQLVYDARRGYGQVEQYFEFGAEWEGRAEEVRVVLLVDEGFEGDGVACREGIGEGVGNLVGRKVEGEMWERGEVVEGEAEGVDMRGKVVGRWELRV